MGALLAVKTIDEQILDAYQSLVAARQKGDNLGILIAEARDDELLDHKLAQGTA